MKLNYDFKMRVDNDLFMSVFNLSNIDRTKANKAYISIYGKLKFRKLQTYINKEGGIMSIFNQTLTDDLIMYALMITQAQNQRKD